MNKENNEQLIKDFLELWQEQFAYIARETDIVKAALRNFNEINREFFNTGQKENSE